MPEVIDFSESKEWTGWWLVLAADRTLLCKVKASNYDGAVVKARNRHETTGKSFVVVPEEKRE